MDYLSIEIPAEKKKRLHGYTAEYKLRKFLFVLSLYPDIGLASLFSGIGNYRIFLPYWLGQDMYQDILKITQKRRENLTNDEDIFVVLETLFEKYNNGENYLDPYLSEEEILIREQEEKTDFGVDYNIIVSGEERKRRDLTFESIIEYLDALLKIELYRDNPYFPSGDYWVVSYTLEKKKGRMRPFLLLAKIDLDTGKIKDIQGAFPLSYMCSIFNKMLEMPYRTTMEEEKIFVHIDVITELEIKRGGKVEKIIPATYTTKIRRIDDKK